MDGVKARLHEKLNPREPKAVVHGLGKELMRIHEFMSGTPLLEISDQLTMTSLSVFKTKCLGVLPSLIRDCSFWRFLFIGSPSGLILHFRISCLCSRQLPNQSELSARLDG